MKFRGLKVYPLEYWMSDEWFDDPDFREFIPSDIYEITPKIGRDGQYYCRHTNQWWFEFAGKAYTRTEKTSKDMMRWHIETHNIRLLRDHELAAIQQLLHCTNRDVRKAARKALIEQEEAYLVQIGQTMEQRLDSYRFRKEMDDWVSGIPDD